MRAWKLAAMLVLAAGYISVGAAPSGATQPPDHKVTICHATASRTNPYVVITVDVASARLAGHQGHLGPIFSPDLARHVQWGDIIPPTSDDGTRPVTARNWPGGESIWANGCALPGGSTTTTTGVDTTTTGPNDEPTTTAPPPGVTNGPPGLDGPPGLRRGDTPPPTLPRTGSPIALLAGLGAGLVTTGLALRGGRQVS